MINEEIEMPDAELFENLIRLNYDIIKHTENTVHVRKEGKYIVFSKQANRELIKFLEEKQNAVSKSN